MHNQPHPSNIYNTTYFFCPLISNRGFFMKRTIAIALVGACLAMGSALGMDDRARKFALLSKTSPNYIELKNCPKKWQGKQKEVQEILLSQADALSESTFLNDTYVEIDCEKLLPLLEIQPKKPRKKNYTTFILPVATGMIGLYLGFLLAKK